MAASRRAAWAALAGRGLVLAERIALALYGAFTLVLAVRLADRGLATTGWLFLLAVPMLGVGLAFLAASVSGRLPGLPPLLPPLGRRHRPAMARSDPIGLCPGQAAKQAQKEHKRPWFRINRAS